MGENSMFRKDKLTSGNGCIQLYEESSNWNIKRMFDNKYVETLWNYTG